MQTVRGAGLLLAGLMLLTGCTKVVAGTVEPADGLAPRPLSADAIVKVLPTESDLEDVMGEAFRADGTMLTGDVDDMADGLATEADATPHECVGAATSMQRSTYQDADVTAVVNQRWESDESMADVLAAEGGVVALDSTAAANKLFEDFTKQWKECEGQTVTIVSTSVRGGYFTDKVTDVRVEGSVLAATVEFGHTLDQETSPTARAIGVRANCLVEVEVAFYRNATGSGSADPESSAIDVARLMMDKVSDLS